MKSVRSGVSGGSADRRCDRGSGGHTADRRGGELRLVPENPALLDQHAEDFDQLLVSPAPVRLLPGHPLDPEDEEQMRAAVTLRELLETVSGRRITFRGEPDRELSGTTAVRGTAVADTVHEQGEQSGVDAGEIGGGAAVIGGSRAKDVRGGVVPGEGEEDRRRRARPVTAAWRP